MADYPRPSSHFAHRFCRLLTKAAVAQELGPEACWLLTVIAHQEDAKRYAGPVTFWNEQLMPLCGFTSPGRLIRQRNRAVEAGWLHYEAGGKGKVGKYWVEIPKAFANVTDGISDETAEGREVGSISKMEINDGNSISKMETETDLHFQNGRETVGQTEGKRSANGNHSTLTLYPDTSCPGSETPDADHVKRDKPLERYSAEDLETATTIWNLIVAMQPERKPPKLPEWANTVRLMRERDRRSHAEILSLFRWANQHQFWHRNILSPDKLRAKWDDLQLERRPLWEPAAPTPSNLHPRHRSKQKVNA